MKFLGLVLAMLLVAGSVACAQEVVSYSEGDVIVETAPRSYGHYRYRSSIDRAGRHGHPGYYTGRVHYTSSPYYKHYYSYYPRRHYYDYYPRTVAHGRDVSSTIYTEEEMVIP